MMTGIVAQKFLERLSEQQEILSNISDIVMDVYAMESVLLRVEKNLARETANEIHIKIVKTFVNDTMVRVEMNARDILSSTTEGDTLRTYLAVLKRFTKYTPLNTVALRRVIADELIGKEKYSL